MLGEDVNLQAFAKNSLQINSNEISCELIKFPSCQNLLDFYFSLSLTHNSMAFISRDGNNNVLGSLIMSRQFLRLRRHIAFISSRLNREIIHSLTYRSRLQQLLNFQRPPLVLKLSCLILLTQSCVNKHDTRLLAPKE